MNKQTNFALMDIHQKMKANIISIPEIQRGFVWKPRQIEFLWDSIFRKFPIGAFVVAFNESGNYDLIDGQQRCKSVALGFEDTENCHLWIDIDYNPKSSDKTTRRFLFRATTLAHPWGFEKDDDCSTFGTVKERRKAMEKFGEKYRGKSLYEVDVNLNETWPVKSNLPVPLPLLFNNIEKQENDFVETCYENMKQLQNWSEIQSNKRYTEEKIKELLKKYYRIISSLKEYIVPFCLLPNTTIESESTIENEDAEKANIEILFDRIARNGTVISVEELNYSVIKTYFPKIKEIIQKIYISLPNEYKYMPDYKLANLIFRLYMLQKNRNKSWVNSVSIQGVRELSKKEKTVENLNSFFTKIETIVKTVEHWLSDGEYGLPSILKSEIIVHEPDIYLLLMWFASENAKLDENYPLALACYLKWFVSEPKKCVKEIYECCAKCGITKENILAGLYSSRINNDNIMQLCLPKDLRNMLEKQSFKSNWTQYNMENEKCFNVWENIIWNEDLLYYAQRKYMTEKFHKFIEEYNRPWDIDHILPKSWVHKKRGVWKKFCDEWVDAIGNKAAIPFEENRAKSDAEDWSYYEDNTTALLFDNKISECNRAICGETKQAKKFADITAERTIKIYEQAYHLVKEVFECGKLTICSKEDSEIPIFIKRKRFFEIVQSKLTQKGIVSYTMFYKDSDSVENEEKFEIKNDYLLATPYISIIVEVGNSKNCVIGITDDYGRGLQIGIRKYPNKEIHENFINKLKLPEKQFPDFSIIQDDVWWYCRNDSIEYNLSNVASVVKQVSNLLIFLTK